MKNKTPKNYTSLKEALTHIDKDVLISFAEHFEATIPESLPKEEFADKLSSSLLANTPEWLKKLPPYDIEILKELSNLEAGTRLVKPRPHHGDTCFVSPYGIRPQVRHEPALELYEMTGNIAALLVKVPRYAVGIVSVIARMG